MAAATTNFRAGLLHHTMPFLIVSQNLLADNSQLWGSEEQHTGGVRVYYIRRVGRRARPVGHTLINRGLPTKKVNIYR